MCAHCGCSAENNVTVTHLESGRHVHLDAEGREQVHDHAHHGAPGHQHSHAHAREPGVTIHLEHEILSKNNRLAEQNRGWLDARGVRAVNLMSSPGAGKTTLLERAIRQLGTELKICVIEGDQETTRDAERIRAAGCGVVQINTGAGCHLDAAMVAQALRQLDPPRQSLVLIENVGNLVCPALFDLGEEARVVVASVTEGDDKPAKYPHMFRAADVIVLNKMDLLPHVEFNPAAFGQAVHELNPHSQIIQVSAIRGEGLEVWHQWLRGAGTRK